jgi:hypothetical protein
MTTLYVGHPTSDHGCSCPGGSFPVFIYCDPPAANITFAFAPNGGIPAPTEMKKVLPPPYNRIFHVTGLQPNKEVLMVVTATDATAGSASVVRMITTHQAGLAAAPVRVAGVRGPIYRAGLTVSNPLLATDPTAPVNVEPNFPVCGYVNPTSTPVSAWVEDSNGNITQGVAVVPPPSPYNWAFMFTLPANGEYTLVVEAGSGGQSNTAIGFVTTP